MQEYWICTQPSHRAKIWTGIDLDTVGLLVQILQVLFRWISVHRCRRASRWNGTSFHSHHDGSELNIQYWGGDTSLTLSLVGLVPYSNWKRYAVCIGVVEGNFWVWTGLWWSYIGRAVEYWVLYNTSDRIWRRYVRQPVCVTLQTYKDVRLSINRFFNLATTTTASLHFSTLQLRNRNANTTQDELLMEHDRSWCTAPMYSRVQIRWRSQYLTQTILRIQFPAPWN